MSLFITFEGIEGCGKTTQMEMLEASLKKEGLSVTATREPGGTEIGERLRPILLKKEGDKLSSWAELFLYVACRAQLVDEVIRPALKQGKIVLCDRFHDSTMVYQGFGKGLDLKVIDTLNEAIIGSIRPNITFILDCPIEKGLERAWRRINASSGDLAKENRFEMADISFHEKIREGYLRLAATEERFKIIQGDREKGAIHKEMYSIVKTCLAKVSIV